MTIQNACIVLSIFINFILIFALVKYAKKSRSLAYFFLFIATILLWSISELAYRVVFGGNIEVLTKLLYVMAGFTSTSFFYFTLVYPEEKQISLKVKTTLIAELLTISILTAGSNTIVRTSIPNSFGNHTVIFGNLYFLYTLHILGIFTFALYVLFRKYFSIQDASQKKKVIDVLVGSTIAATFAMTTNLLAPYFGINNLDWLGPIFCMTIAIFVTKGMLSEKIFGAKMFFQRKVITRVTVFALLLTYLGVLYLAYLFYHFLTSTTFHADTKTIAHLGTFLFTFLFIIIFLSAILFSRSKKDTLRKIFIFMLFILAGWVATLVGSELTSSSTNLLLGARLPYYFILWLPPTYIVFFHYIIHKKFPKPIALISLALISTTILILSQTRLYIVGIHVFSNGSQEVDFGPLYAYDSLYYFVAVFLSGLMSVKNWSRLGEAQKRILKIIAPWYLTAMIPPVITQVIFPTIGFSYYYAPFGTIAGVVCVVTSTSIAIFREKFLNIKLRIQRSLFLRSIAFLTTILYLSAIFVLYQTSSLLRTNRESAGMIISQNISSFILLVVLIIFATYLILKKRETQTQKTFVLLVLSTIVSLFGMIMSSIVPFPHVLLWERLVYVGAGWIPSLIFLLFYFYVSDKQLSWKKTVAILTPGLALALLGQTPLLIRDVTQVAPFTYNDVLGPLYSIEGIYYPIVFIAIAYVIQRNWSRLTNQKRRHIWFLLLGYFVAILPPLMVNVILHNFFDASPYYQLAFDSGVLIFILVTASGIFNYKLFGIKIRITATIVRKLFAAVLVVFILPLLIWFLLTKQYLPENTAGRIIAIAFIILALFPLFSRLLENFINKTIFKNTKTPAEIVNSIVEKISTTPDASLLTKILLEELTEQLNLSGAAYFANANGHFEFQIEIHFPEAKNLAEFSYGEKIIEILRQENSYTQESLRKLPDTKDLLKILESTNTEVIVPFKIENELVGLLALKEKRHNEAFSKDELHILDTLSFHLAATIHNAFLFAKVKNFAHDLEKKVEQATNALKAKNEELAKVQEDKSQFFADIAHEFKTPITVMKGNIDILAPSLPKDQGLALQKEVYRMNQLTTDLLELSRAETGEIQLHYENVDVSELVISVISEIQTLALDRKIIICNHLEKNIRIRSDRTRLRQIILNLLTNAIKYNKDGGRIDIDVKENDSQICLSVSDTGIGIPQDQLNKVFERFFRVDKSYSKKQGGTGLGLAIVKLMTELHGGTVQVESEEEKGTKFTVCLPKQKL